MAISNLSSSDFISASEGQAFMTVDGKNYPLFYLKKLEAKISKNKKDAKVVGRRAVGQKTLSWKGAGTLTITKVTSFFDEMVIDYIKNGVDRYFSIQIVNEDPSTQWGRSSIVLIGCNLDELPLGGLDSEDNYLEAEMPFTFEDVDLLSKFNS